MFCILAAKLERQLLSHVSIGTPPLQKFTSHLGPFPGVAQVLRVKGGDVPVGLQIWSTQGSHVILNVPQVSLDVLLRFSGCTWPNCLIPPPFPDLGQAWVANGNPRQDVYPQQGIKRQHGCLVIGNSTAALECSRSGRGNQFLRTCPQEGLKPKLGSSQAELQPI